MFYFRHGNCKCRYSDSKTRNGEINPEPCKAHWKRGGSDFKFNYHNPRGEVDHATANEIRKCDGTARKLVSDLAKLEEECNQLKTKNSNLHVRRRILAKNIYAFPQIV